MPPWIIVLGPVFLGLLAHVEGRATVSLHGPQTHVVLAGHKLHLNFSVNVPSNSSDATLACYHGKRRVTVKSNISSPTHGKRVLAIDFNSSSESGEYCCRLTTHAHDVHNIYLAILVRDKGFTETYHGLTDEVVAPVAAVTIFFLVFSVVGTIYICRSQTAKGGQGGGTVSVTGTRTSAAGVARTSVASGNSGVQEVKEEEGGANSVYTTLESRPASIYDVLDPSVSGNRARSKKSSRKRSKKQEEAASEDGIFESVYENV